VTAPKFVAGAGLEIFFECDCSPFVSESVITHEVPRTVFCRMRRTARIVIRDPAAKIACDADVFFRGRVERFEDVHVVHGVPVVARLALLRQASFAEPTEAMAYGGHPSR
jgi:hypothetical protein